MTPATLFALKMGVCLALFLLGAAWLRRLVDRVKRARGLPPRDSSVLQAFAHYFKGSEHARSSGEHERRLYRQTIRILARELQRLDADNEDAREAIDLLMREADQREPVPRRRLAAPGVTCPVTMQVRQSMTEWRLDPHDEFHCD